MSSLVLSILIAVNSIQLGEKQSAAQSEALCQQVDAVYATENQFDIDQLKDIENLEYCF